MSNCISQQFLFCILMCTTMASLILSDWWHLNFYINIFREADATGRGGLWYIGWQNIYGWKITCGWGNVWSAHNKMTKMVQGRLIWMYFTAKFVVYMGTPRHDWLRKSTETFCLYICTVGWPKPILEHCAPLLKHSSSNVGIIWHWQAIMNHLDQGLDPCFTWFNFNMYDAKLC